MDFIIKFAQAHESFRVAEIQALAEVESLKLDILQYKNDVRKGEPYDKKDVLKYRLVTTVYSEAGITRTRRKVDTPFNSSTINTPAIWHGRYTGAIAHQSPKLKQINMGKL